MKKHINDIFKLISPIGIGMMLSIKAAGLFRYRDYDAGLVLTLANILFCYIFILAIKNMKIFKYALIVHLVYFSLFFLITTFKSLDFYFLIQPILIVLYFIFYKIKQKKEQGKNSSKETTDYDLLYPVIAAVSVFIAIMQVVIIVKESKERIQEKEQAEIERLQIHQEWVNEMSYKILNLSTNHHITYEELKGSGLTHSKVVAVDESKVKLVAYNSYGEYPVMMKESFENTAATDTIEVTKKELYKSLVSKKIKLDTHLYKDSLLQNGVKFMMYDIKYIDGPQIQSLDDIILGDASEKDTITFNLINFYKKSKLTNIQTIKSDAKWHVNLPLTIKEFDPYTYRNKNSTIFMLEATNLDLEKDYEFKLYFEDENKQEHIFQITKKSSMTYKINKVYK